MLSVLKDALADTIKELNVDNMASQKQLLQSQLNILDELCNLRAFKKEHCLPQETADNAQTDRKETHEEAEHTESPEEYPKKFAFERKIRGGSVPDINGYVPERVVRELGLHHGDKVYASAVETNDPKKNYFKYKLAEKGTLPEDTDRVQYNYCPVKTEAGRLVVDKSEETGELIRNSDGLLYTVILNENDVFDFKLKEGDLIDIAFSKENIEHARVIWRHPIEELVIPKPTPTGSKKTEKQDKKPVTIYDQSLSDKAVLVIGNEPMKSLYKMSIERRGGEFLWGDAKDSLVRLEASVKKADICVFLLNCSGHTGMEHIKQMCKDHDVAFETTWSSGQATVVRIAEEV